MQECARVHGGGAPQGSVFAWCQRHTSTCFRASTRLSTPPCRCVQASGRAPLAQGQWEKGQDEARALSDLGPLCSKMDDSTWWL